MMIDLRARIPAGPYLLDEGLFDVNRINKFDKMFKSNNISAKNKDLEGFWGEMKTSGIDKVVAQVRRLNRAVTPEGLEKVKQCDKNEMLVELLSKYPDKLIGMAGIEPNNAVETSLQEIEKFVVKGPAAGICLEPGYSPIPMAFDDAKLYPIYEYCEKNRVPISLSFGGLCSPDLNNMSPWALDRVTVDFPDLHIILAHGGYPWINQVCWLALKRKGLYIAPDMYIIASGGSAYVEATKAWIPDKILFASMYPLCSLERAVEIYKEAGFDEEVFPMVMGENAEKALFLTE